MLNVQGDLGSLWPQAPGTGIIVQHEQLYMDSKIHCIGYQWSAHNIDHLFPPTGEYLMLK